MAMIKLLEHAGEAGGGSAGEGQLTAEQIATQEEQAKNPEAIPTVAPPAPDFDKLGEVAGATMNEQIPKESDADRQAREQMEAEQKAAAEQRAKESNTIPTGETDKEKTAKEESKQEQQAGKEREMTSEQKKAAEDFAKMPYYEQFFDKMLEELELPEGYKKPELTPENYLDEVAKVISMNMDATDDLDPNVKRLQELVTAHEGNFEAAMKDFNAAGSYKNMSADKLVEWDLTKNLKLSPEKVKEMMANMNVELEGARIRQKLGQQEDRYIEAKKQELINLREQEIRQNNEKFSKDLEETIGTLKNKNEYCGIPADAKQMQEFPDIFKHYVTPGEDGVPPIAKLLTDNDFLSDVVFLGHYRSKALKDFVDKQKDNIKQTYQKKLDPEPKHTEKSVTHVAKELDFDKLAAPDIGSR